MDFAKKLMEKYGWKEGDGLGKNSDGRIKPVKASLKFDSTGLGCDKAKEFNNHWWERVFNEAANNVEVGKTEDGKVALNIKDEDSVEITTKEYSVRKLKKIRGSDGYDNFLKHSKLTNTGNEEELEGTIHDDDIKIKTKVVHLTDEELFAACGGRTAHKGARHGHTMKSKISRLEAQEQALLEQMLKSKRDLEEKDRNGFIQRKEKIVADEPKQDNEEPPKKKKKKSKDCEQVEDVAEENCTIKKKKKSKTNDLELEKEDLVDEKSSSKKNKKSNKESSEIVPEIIAEEETCTKKKKKSKRQDVQEEIDESNLHKKSKKSKKK